MREQFLLPFFLTLTCLRRTPIFVMLLKYKSNPQELLKQDTFAATLHCQLAYRLQNHAFDMAVPEIAQSNDALLIQVNLGMTPMCTFVPRQLNKDQMTSLFPESWITKYEMLYQATKPIQSIDPFFIRKANGEVETKFLMAPSEKKDVTVFPT